MNLLEGKKVKLRALEPEDIDLLMAWENNTPNWQVSGTVAPFSRAILKDFISNSHLDIYQTRQLRFMIETLEGPATIGTIDLFEFDPFHQRAGVGVLIADPAQRNNGYASESVELVKEYCFKHLGLHQLFCNILEGNEASLRLFKKAGFELSGSKKAWVRLGQSYKDEYFLQLFNQR